LKNQFEKVFSKTYSRKSNDAYVKQVQLSFSKKDWKKFLALILKAVSAVEKKLQQIDTNKEDSSKETQKQKQPGMNPNLRRQWKDVGSKAAKLETQLEQLHKSFAFSFVEGSLVTAVRNGQWVLLDEINLAPTETLEVRFLLIIDLRYVSNLIKIKALSGLLEGGSLCLTERGDIEPVPRHPNFRLFACMNPPTDVGKKYLPPGLRNRFTEFYVDETKSIDDLRIVVESYLKAVLPSTATNALDDVVNLYLAAREHRGLLGKSATDHICNTQF